MSLAGKIIAISERRSPDFVVGGALHPYLKRWWLIPRNRFFNIYLHQFLRSDDDRALHDHPWFNLSILLRGYYIEVTPHGDKIRGPGAVILRSPWSRHRIELLQAGSVARLQKLFPHIRQECWTIFITGPRLRDWGFHCPQGFVPWQKFTSPADKGNIGKGCDQ